MQAEFRVVDFVVDVLLETVVSSVHPSDVRVALLVHADGGVERVGVVDGDTGVVHDDQVAVSTCTGVFRVAAALRGVARQPGCETWVVVHLGIGVKHGHVDFTRVVGGDVDHGLNEEGHLVGTAARGELVGLATRIGVGQGVPRTVSGLGRNDAVGTLDEVHEVRLDVSSAAIALAVQANGNDASQQTVVVSFLDGCFVIGLLGRVAVLGPFVGNRDDDLGGVWVPSVVRLSRWVSGNVSSGVLPGETGPV